MATAVYTPSWTIPGPRPLPFIGRTINVFRYISDPIGHASRLFKQYGRIVSLAEGGGTNVFSPYDTPGTIFVYGPELIRQARTPHERWNLPPLTGPLYPLDQPPPRKATLKHFLARPWGLDGEEHRAQRKLVLPAFHHKRIAAYRDDMVAITQSVLDTWHLGTIIDVPEQLRHLTARVATKTLFGEDSIEDSGSAGRTLQHAITTLSKPLTTLLPYDVPGLPYRRFLDLLPRFDAQMRAIIQRKRATGHDDGDVLSMLLHARDEESNAALAEEEVIAWVGSLFGAGHETSSLALTWTLLLLSQHPHITADLVDELTGTLQGDPPTLDHLRPDAGHLPLLEAVVKESLRILPPAPMTWRLAAHATELGGYDIPQGAEVYGSIYHTHHMPELYSEPERFNPRRWETINPSAWEYIPFNAGPRMCIGASFALMEIKIVLAMLLQRFRMQFVPKAPIDRYGIITTGPKYGLPMIVHPQDRRFDHGVGGVRGNVREMVQLPE